MSIQIAGGKFAQKAKNFEASHTEDILRLEDKLKSTEEIKKKLESL